VCNVHSRRANASRHSKALANDGVAMQPVLEVAEAAPLRAKPRIARPAVGTPTATKSPAKESSPRKPRRPRAVDDGFGEVFGPGLEVTPGLLVGFGVPRTTFTNWLQAGVLACTTTRGV